MRGRQPLQPPTKQHEPDGQFHKYPSYRGGPTTTYGGYVWEFVGEHPLANKWGFVAQHRLVGADLVGRPLRKGEVVHHRNEVRADNRPENLEVMTASAHRAHHAKQTALANQIPLCPKAVAEALSRHRAVKPAARELGVSHGTLRLRFPELCAPHRRKSPTKIEEDPHLDEIRALSADPRVGLRQAAAQTGMSIRTFCRIAERNGIAWVKQTRSDKGRARPGGRPPAPAGSRRHEG